MHIMITKIICFYFANLFFAVYCQLITFCFLVHVVLIIVRHLREIL